MLTDGDILAQPLKITFIEFQDGKINMNHVKISD